MREEAGAGAGVGEGFEEESEGEFVGEGEGREEGVEVDGEGLVGFGASEDGVPFECGALDWRWMVGIGFHWCTSLLSSLSLVNEAQIQFSVLLIYLNSRSRIQHEFEKRWSVGARGKGLLRRVLQGRRTDGRTT